MTLKGKSDNLENVTGQSITIWPVVRMESSHWSDCTTRMLNKLTNFGWSFHLLVCLRTSLISSNVIHIYFYSVFSVLMLQVSLNSGKTFVSSNVNISAKNCTNTRKPGKDNEGCTNTTKPGKKNEGCTNTTKPGTENEGDEGIPPEVS